jgi:hypothetical protein
MRGRFWLAVIAATFALAAPAVARTKPEPEPPVTISTLPDAAGSSSSAFKVGNLVRPAMLGLIAALFLICGALVAENHGPPKSRR